jgi:hypothetical protein
MRKQLRSREARSTAVGTLFADHATPLYPQRMAKQFINSGGRWVGIVCFQTKNHGVCLFVCLLATQISFRAVTDA